MTGRDGPDAPAHGLLHRLFAAHLERLFRRRTAVLAASALVLVLLGVVGARLRLSTDWVEPFLPESDVELRTYADALRRFGQTETLYVDVRAEPPDALHAAADAVETRMRASGLFARVVGRLDEWDLKRTADATLASIPALLDDAGLRELAARTTPEALSARLEEHYERLLGPVGGLYQEALAKDPLELASMALERASGADAGATARVERGRIVSGDGKHALVLGVAHARVGDEEAGRAIHAFFDELTERTARGEGGAPPAELVWVGGHRHYLANSTAIQRDMTFVTSLAVALVLAVIVVGFRGARITWISMVAVAVGSVAGAAALVALWGEASGIALGFGAALSGISVDYVIHLHAERRRGETRRDAVRRVFLTTGPSVLIGAITSAAGFFVLLSSDVPAHRQLGVAAGCGIFGALLFALFPGPLVAAAGRRDDPAPAPDPPNAVDGVATRSLGWILRRPGLAFGIGALLVALGAAAAPRVGFESNLRRFEVKETSAQEAQTVLSSTWGDVFQQQLVVVPGPDVQTVLERTDRLVAALAPFEGRDVTTVASTSPVLPALATQAERRARWLAFWTPERRASLRRDLTAAAAEFQIKASTFDPFFASIDAEPAPLTAGRLAGTPLESVVARHLSVREGDVLGLAVVSGADRPGERAEDSAWARAARAAVPEARVLSGKGLAEAVAGATRRQFAALAVPALVLVWALLLAYYRDVVLATTGVFPLVGGLLLAAGVFLLCGERLNLLNAAVALPVFGLGVDYAVFLVDAMRDAAREFPGDGAEARRRRTHEVGLRMGTMVGDVLTTLAGAVALLFATTPAIASIGLAMAAGVGGALLVAWLMVPQVLVWTGRFPR